MRIRKHAKISPLLFSTTSLSSEKLLQTHFCRLNQSPWDVITFPPSDSSTPPPFQVNEEDSFTGNGSLGDSIGAVESVASMKIPLEGYKDKKEHDAFKWDFSKNREEKEDRLGFKKKGEAILCCKTDGKDWQCRQEAKEGYTLCDHHLAQLKNYNTLAHPLRKKSDKPSAAAAEGNHRRRRPRVKKSSTASNPHEFYYYSGFGPLWGKKRGPGRKTTIDDMGINPLKVVVPPAEAATTTSSTSQMVDDVEFGYVEDEYEDEDDDNVENGKKRGRKPIKARSLKSLM